MSGVDSPDPLELRRRQTRRLLLMLPVMFLAGLAGWIGQSLTDGRTLGGGELVVALGVSVGLTAVVGLIWFLARRAGASWMQPSTLLAMPAADRRGVVRTVRRGGPVAPEQRAAVIEVARAIRRCAWVGWVWLLMAALQVVRVVEAGARPWFPLLMTAVAIGLGAYYILLVRGARAILAEQDARG